MIADGINAVATRLVWTLRYVMKNCVDNKCSIEFYARLNKLTFQLDEFVVVKIVWTRIEFKPVLTWHTKLRS